VSQARAHLSTRLLLVVVCAYAAASLFHFAHNAWFLDEYPNLPVWLTRGQVYAAWLCLTAVGALGLVLTRTRYALAGFAVLALYGLLGLDGLAHYSVAPMSAHTATMNLSIGIEVSMALVLLAVVTAHAIRRIRT
jgi:hypothetical protein